MKRKRLLKTLAELLDREGRKQRKHHDELKTLLEKLKKKQVELEEEMLLGKDERKHKRVSKELQVVKAQHAKGVKALQGLEES